MSSKGVAAREWHTIESGFGIRQSGVCGTAASPLRGPVADHDVQSQLPSHQWGQRYLPHRSDDHLMKNV